MKKYSCEKGHVFEFPEGATWTSLRIVTNTWTRDFQFCPVCQGEWAEAKWPLKLTEKA